MSDAKKLVDAVLTKDDGHAAALVVRAKLLARGGAYARMYASWVAQTR